MVAGIALSDMIGISAASRVAIRVPPGARS
jgi:hypothetical protein